jgi:hypothetical protein
MLALALQEQSEVSDQQHAAKEGEEYPKGRKSDYVDEEDAEPEKDGHELTEPEDGNVDVRRDSVLR